MSESTCFVAKDIPGLPDGHPLFLRPKFDPAHAAYGGREGWDCELIGSRIVEGGLSIVVIIPATPANFDKHVRTADLPEDQMIKQHPRGF